MFLKLYRIFGILALLSSPVCAGETRVAVAANFTAAAESIADAFHASSGHTAHLSFGSTGQLYAQILHGAPYDVFLAADTARPQKAIDEKLALKGSTFTYAIGRIALYSPNSGRVLNADSLKDPSLQKIAIANPQTAPYGAAAMEVLKALGLYDPLRDKFVQGTNIAQTYQFVATGNADLGFVALSQLKTNPTGSYWLVAESLHAPIRQDAVLLVGGGENEAALAFMTFLKSPESARIISSFGYGTDGGLHGH